MLMSNAARKAKNKKYDTSTPNPCGFSVYPSFVSKESDVGVVIILRHIATPVKITNCTLSCSWYTISDFHD